MKLKALDQELGDIRKRYGEKSSFGISVAKTGFNLSVNPKKYTTNSELFSE